jgi:hypothetical protein
MADIFELKDDETPAPKVGKTASKEPTILEQLKTTISKKVERTHIYIEVPEREGVTIKVSPNVTQNQLRAWRKNAGEDTKTGLDPTKFACQVVGHTTEAICFNGEEVFNEDGVMLTFASPEIMQMTNTTRPLPDCVREFFGIDPHVEAAALAIMEHAGYSDTVETVDPFKQS